MSRQIKNNGIAIFVFIAFMSMFVFGITSITNMNMDQNANNNCPIALGGDSTCPPGLLETTIHHLSIYQSFFNIFISENVFLLASLIIFLAFLYLFNKRLIFEFNILDFSRCLYPKKKFRSFKSRKIIKWLSLFENSPSFYIGA